MYPKYSIISNYINYEKYNFPIKKIIYVSIFECY